MADKLDNIMERFHNYVPGQHTFMLMPNLSKSEQVKISTFKFSESN